MALGANPVSISLHCPTPDDGYLDDEEEIDQLDSGLDSAEEEDELEEARGSSAKPRPRKTGERAHGHTLIPSTRVENILQGSEAGQHLSKEALFMLSVATEEFVKKLAHAGQRVASRESRSLVHYRDVAFLTQRHREFRFAQDVVPSAMSLADALERRETREKELANDDPAIAALVDPWATPTSTPAPAISQAPVTSSASAKTKIKGRQSAANGEEKEKEEADGSANTLSKPRQRDSSGRYSSNGKAGESRSAIARSSVGTRPSSSRIRERTSRASEGSGQSASRNGTPHANGTPSTSRGSMAPPPPPRPSSSLSNRTLARGEEGRVGGYPTARFLDDHRLLNGVNRGSGMSDAPGRTIYSAQRSPSTQLDR